MFWPALSIAAKMDRMKQAEARLLSLAREFGDRSGYEFKITTMDTTIPRHVVPLLDNDTNDEDLTIHAVKVQANNNNNSGKNTQEIPLVLMHGYMNAAAYFYRNLVGLTHYFNTVYSLDMLGWGLSSRPNFVLKEENGDGISATEKFFVESLEAWRKKNDIPKMILAGHSMGGYMAVAYTEAYPQHVEKLLLLSPAGVPEESEESRQKFAAMRQKSWRFWFLSGFFHQLFEYSSGGMLFRGMPSTWSENMSRNYVTRRMPMISKPEEQEAISEYLVANNMLPGSGEHCLNKVLNANVHAKRPLEHRIPNLKVSKVAFMYGEFDWMDPKGGLTVQRKCEAQPDASPEVEVYSIRKAGHLLMLENWMELNASVILGAGGSVEHLPANTQLPIKLNPSTFVEDPIRPTPSLKRSSSTSSLSDASAEPGVVS